MILLLFKTLTPNLQKLEAKRWRTKAMKKKKKRVMKRMN